MKLPPDCRVAGPSTLVGAASSETGSFGDAVVELRDGDVAWRVICERSVLRIEAAPDFDRSEWFDAALLSRFLRRDLGLPKGLKQVLPPHPTSSSVEDAMKGLDMLRQPVAAAFKRSTWETTRRELIDAGRRRDADLFGRRYSPPDS